MKNQGPFDFLETIPGDEPVFIIRAQDTLFQTVCRAWIREAEALGVDEEKINGAKAILVEGAEWQAKNRNKVKRPD